jgi:hypothetical protein
MRRLALAAALSASAQAAVADDWAEEKCRPYAAAWAAVAPGEDAEGIGRAFRDDHAAFLKSGCTSPEVCPHSSQERSLADLLTLMAVAEGMTGSFLPFDCPG